MKALPEATGDSLKQVLLIIDQVLGFETQFNRSVYVDCRIGPHVRHITDHFQALQHGLPLSYIDYNQRHRESSIETQPEEAITLIQQLIAWLGTVVDMDAKLTVHSEISCEQFVSVECRSNLGRELLYLINHTIHHCAYMKKALEVDNLSLPSFIGLAPCTATFLREADHQSVSG